MVNHPSRRIIFKLQITLAFKILKFSYCEKATKIWKNSPFVLRRKLISKHGGIIFLILLPSHNNWTLKSGTQLVICNLKIILQDGGLPFWKNLPTCFEITWLFKTKWEIFQIFMAFLEYLNFNPLDPWAIIRERKVLIYSLKVL